MLFECRLPNLVCVTYSLVTSVFSVKIVNFQSSTMSWWFIIEEKDDIFIEVQGFRAKNQRGEILGRVEAIEIGNSADQLKVSAIDFFIVIFHFKVLFFRNCNTKLGLHSLVADSMLSRFNLASLYQHDIIS